MPSYERCPVEVAALAREVLASNERYTPLIEARVIIDYVFAMPDVDDHGKPTGPAITVHGMSAAGRAKKTSLLDRSKGLADAEILIDREWWEMASRRQSMALLAHELHHFIVVTGRTDDLRRPILKLRKHDRQFGWFDCIAREYGPDSLECSTAKSIMDEAGQYYWPLLAESGTEYKPAA